MSADELLSSRKDADDLRAGQQAFQDLTDMQNDEFVVRPLLKQV